MWAFDAVGPSSSSTSGLSRSANPDCCASEDQDVIWISVITPPPVTEKVVAEAVELGIQNIWLQPGAESDQAIAQAEAAGVNLIAGGPCLLVALAYRDDA